jgi:hypothetical protein
LALVVLSFLNQMQIAIDHLGKANCGRCMHTYRLELGDKGDKTKHGFLREPRLMPAPSFSKTQWIKSEGGILIQG